LAGRFSSGEHARDEAPEAGQLARKRGELAKICADPRVPPEVERVMSSWSTQGEADADEAAIEDVGAVLHAFKPLRDNRKGVESAGTPTSSPPPSYVR
jgi:hypothetical protein